MYCEGYPEVVKLRECVTLDVVTGARSDVSTIPLGRGQYALAYDTHPIRMMRYERVVRVDKTMRTMYICVRELYLEHNSKQYQQQNDRDKFNVKYK